MVLRIKLGDYRTVAGDPLGRAYIGYFPRMTETEAWEAARGIWKLSERKVRRERFVLVVGNKQVRAVAEISSVIAHNDRKELQGQLLGPRNPPPCALARVAAGVNRSPTGISCPVTKSAPSKTGYAATSAAI